MGYLSALDPDAARAEEQGGHDNMFAHVLAVGDGLMSVLAAASGELLTSAVVPSPPVMKPILVRVTTTMMLMILIFMILMMILHTHILNIRRFCKRSNDGIYYRATSVAMVSRI